MTRQIKLWLMKLFLRLFKEELTHEFQAAFTEGYLTAVETLQEQSATGISPDQIRDLLRSVKHITREAQ